MNPDLSVYHLYLHHHVQEKQPHYIYLLLPMCHSKISLLATGDSFRVVDPGEVIILIWYPVWAGS